MPFFAAFCMRVYVCVQARQTEAVNSPLSWFDTIMCNILHVSRSDSFIPSLFRYHFSHLFPMTFLPFLQVL